MRFIRINEAPPMQQSGSISNFVLCICYQLKERESWLQRNLNGKEVAQEGASSELTAELLFFFFLAHHSDFLIHRNDLFPPEPGDRNTLFGAWPWSRPTPLLFFALDLIPSFSQLCMHNSPFLIEAGCHSHNQTSTPSPKSCTRNRAHYLF